jgi:type I restriction enzyme S subunit
MKYELLGDIVDVSKGRKHNPSETPNSDSKRIIGINDLRNDATIVLTDDQNGVEASEKDVLIAWDGANAGTIGFGKKGFIGSTISRLRIKNTEKYNEIFLGKLLQSKFDYLRSSSTGATIPHINRAALDCIKVPQIELSEQLRIADVLTRAEKLIAKRKESIKSLDEFLKSIFLEMFGDPVRNEKNWGKETLRGLSIRFSDGPFGSNLKTSHYEKNGIRVIRLNNIGINKFMDDDKAFISQKHFDDVLKKYACYPSDVVIGTMGEPNIRACIIPEYIPMAVNKADCVLCRPNINKALPEYIAGIMNLPSFLSLASNLFHGQTRTRVSMGQLATLEIPVPPIDLQNKFAAIVEQVEAMKVKYNESLVEMEKLYGGLSQRAFRG